MPQTAFLQNFLIRFASFLSSVFLLIGLALAFSGNSLGLPVITGGALLSIGALIVANLINSGHSKDLKNAVETAAEISEGQINFDFENETSSELKILLKEIAAYLSEKAAIADRIATGDLSAEVVLRSETDVFGKSFQNMINKLRVHVQTEEERDYLQKSILKLTEEVSEVAAGDLTVTAEVIASETTGAIAEAFNLMTTELRSLIGRVKDVTFQVGNSANDINYTTEQLARGSEAQASQIERTTQAVSAMARQVQEVSNNASLSAQVAAEALDNARYGTKAARDNTEAMNSIRRQVQETARRIKKLGERSQEISQTVSLIDDLSDRTSLLALNASLQAAAGEAGRGFAVVAEEIERLAERSNHLTQQIASLAQTIQSETKDVVASMEETIHEVVVGSALADKAGQTLFEIEQVSGRLAELIGSISESAKQQAQSSEDISKAMANISKVTELVNVGSKRAADSVKTLVALSDDLRGSVAPFKLPNEKIQRRQSASETREIYLN